MARDGPLHDNPLVDRLCSSLPRGDVQRVIGQIRSLVVARWVTKLELLRAEVEREVDELRTADVQAIFIQNAPELVREIDRAITIELECPTTVWAGIGGRACAVSWIAHERR
jgi:hypothetical protein